MVANNSPAKTPFDISKSSSTSTSSVHHEFPHVRWARDSCHVNRGNSALISSDGFEMLSQTDALIGRGIV